MRMARHLHGSGNTRIGRLPAAGPIAAMQHPLGLFRENKTSLGL